MMTIITFVVILSVLVLVHEFGHFFTAKKMGVRVNEFGIGLPPKIFSVKKTDTIYSLNWIPFGGFVKIKGEDGSDKNERDSFASKKIWQRGLILSNGIIMNFILAVILLSIGFLTGIPLNTDNLPKYAKIKNENIIIAEVLPNFPAQKAELKAGDILLSLDGEEFKEIEKIQNYINSKKTIEIKIKRQDSEIVKSVSAVDTDGRHIIGVALSKTGIVSFPWYLSLWAGLKTTFNLTVQIIIALFYLFKHLIFQRVLTAEITGPIGVAVMTHTMVKMGFAYVLQFTALISVNLAIINFLPFPALDGGRVLFLILEKIKGRPINPKTEAIIHTIGFGFLIFLMFLVTYRDLARFGGRIFQKVIGG